MTGSVKERFPRREAEISLLYLIDQDFRSLCHNHAVCVNELGRSLDTPSSYTARRYAQWLELRDELEVEIAEYLDARLTKNGSSDHLQ